MLLLCLILTSACSASTDPEKMPSEEELTSESPAAPSEDESTPAQDFSGINELEPNSDGVYQIYSAKGLANMADHPDGRFELLTDIDMEGAQWIPVGTQAAPFTGSFGGKGFIISNLTIREGVDGYTGFFGVNAGNVASLKLENVNISVDKGYAGGLAGRNDGTLDMCAVSGSLTAKASAVAGGLVGIEETGTLSFSESSLRIEADGQATAGLLGGCLKGITVENCTYSGPMNQKDGKLFTGFAGDEQNVEYISCLWRDNSNSSEFLSEEAQRMRDTVEQRMRRMGTIEWTVSENLSFLYPTSTLHNQYFVEGEIYKGVPYTGKCSSIERFLYCFNEDGTLKDFATQKPVGYDNYDMYMGVDCSGAVYWAWAGVSPSTHFHWTQNMLESNAEGCISVGGYEGADTLTDTKQICDLNGEQKMARSYAAMHKGDAITTYYSDPATGAHANHTRLAAQDPVILINSEGDIDLSASYLITHEQGEGLVLGHNTSWMIDRKIPLISLFKGYYVPLTNQELMDGKQPECVVTIDNDKTGKAYMTTGIVETNYRLVSTTIEIKDEERNVVWEKTLFTPVDKFETARSDYVARKTAKSFNLAAFAAYIGEMRLEKGRTYTYELSAVPATGEKYVLKTFDFTE